MDRLGGNGGHGGGRHFGGGDFPPLAYAGFRKIGARGGAGAGARIDRISDRGRAASPLGGTRKQTRSIAGTETRCDRYKSAGGSGGVSCPSSCGSFSLSPFGRRAWIRLLSRPRRAVRQGNSAAEP